jgi:CMP/dCMP kinase
MTLVTITVGGPPGSGTTTACRTLAPRLGIRWEHTGQIFRELAAERGMDLAAFGRWCEDHPEVDRQLDERQLAILGRGNVLLEGRLAGWVAAKHELPAFKVWLTAPVGVRARRVAEREGTDPATTRLDLYGVDLGDYTIYDLVLDTKARSPEEVVLAIIAALEEKRDELWPSP